MGAFSVFYCCSYATRYLVPAIASMMTAQGNDAGLSAMGGVKYTPDFQVNPNVM
jgi:hypothetical protein